MRKKSESKMIIQKTVCDVPDPNGRKLFGMAICGEPAISINRLLLAILFGKEDVHVCAKHAELPLLQLCKLVRGDGMTVEQVDDLQK